MAEITKIQWTDHTFNPWRGCTKVSAGCKHCYAEKLSVRNPNVLGVWGPNGTRPLASENYWREPLKWDRTAAKAGVKARVFCCSLADVFENWPGQMTDGNECPLWNLVGVTEPVAAHVQPGNSEPYTLDDARQRLWMLIQRTPNLTWQLLTKRPENMNKMVLRAWTVYNWPSNVWAMTSIEDQATAVRRIPELLKVPARVRGLSVEPLLGPVDLSFLGNRYNAETNTFGPQRLHWVIIGGESGPHARPCHVEWVRDLVKQCQQAGVACFVKQLGAHIVDEAQECSPVRLGDRLHLQDLKGGQPSEWPEDLRVRQFPE